MAENRATVQSVERAAAVVQVISDAGIPLSVLEIARRTGLNRTVVHRLVKTLQQIEVLDGAANGHVSLGPMLAVYGQGFLDRLPVRQLALPYMLELSRSLDERPWVVALAVPVGDVAVLVDRLWHRDAPLDTLLALGTRLPFSRSAHGRAMLATFPEDRVRRLIGDADCDHLAPKLEQIRNRGYLEFADGELLPGLAAAAVAIRGNDGIAVGSLAISGSDLSPELDAASETSARLMRAAQSVTALLPQTEASPAASG